MPTNYEGVLYTDEAALLEAIAGLSSEQQLYILNDFHGRPHINIQTQVESVVSSAADFGYEMLVSFAAENVLLGITQEGKTGEVLTKLAGVQLAMQAGSLYEAIQRIRAIPQSDYDTKYITAPRLLTFINKIEGYLGVPMSTEL